jgi:hypothetical protein
MIGVIRLRVLGVLLTLALACPAAATADEIVPAQTLFRRENLVAWCIVPFDDEPRSPVDRAAMMKRLGIGKYAYDYRAEHVPQFDDEMRALRAQGIDLLGWWFPGELNEEAKLILGVLERHGMTPSLWVSGGGDPTANAEEQKARVRAEVARLRPIAEAAKRLGCTVGLYNHGGWFGEPDNQIEIIEALRSGDVPITNVGIVYNQHHGHGHVARFRELLARMKPHLQVLNLNGMFADGEARGLKIAPIGTGELDVELLKIVQESGFAGPFGILNHTQMDAEDRLRDNLVGLEWAAAKLDGKAPGPLPAMKTWQAPVAEPKATSALPAAGSPYDPALVAALAAEAHPTIPAVFKPDRAPLSPEAFPDSQVPVNRDRQYDFYAREARWFRGLCPTPPLLPPYPGLDGGQQGHWGNQNEDTWRDGRWNDTILGPVQAGVLHAFGKSIVRGFCVRLGDGINVCFDSDAPSYPVAWTGKLVVLSGTRHGFLGGLAPGGEALALPPVATHIPAGTIDYEGFVRHGERVGFLYRVDGVRFLDVPMVKDGAFERAVGPVATHPLKGMLDGGPPQWPDVIETSIIRGTQKPWAVDTFELPEKNPWKALLFCGDHDFLPDGDIAVCTMQGDVWRAQPIDPGADGEHQRLAWRRIAAGLHQPLGMAVVDGVIHVLSRDQITKLIDTNADGETDR